MGLVIMYSTSKNDYRKRSLVLHYFLHEVCLSCFIQSFTETHNVHIMKLLVTKHEEITIPLKRTVFSLRVSYSQGL